MSRMGGIVRLVTFLFVPFLVFGEVIDVDVRAWADVGTGTTNGWEVGGISRTEDGLTRVKEIADYVRSPEFGFNVTQLVMRVLCASAETKRFLTITPTVSGAEAKKHTAQRSTKLVEQTFVWDLSAGVRQFRLQNDTGEGSTSWGVASLAVYTDRIGPPTGLREGALYRDAFAADWDSAPGAARYQIQCASVTRIPSSYETIVEWDFSSLTNATGNSRDLEALRKEFPKALDGVIGMNLGLQKYDGGHLQIGKDNVAGAMELQLDATVPSRICFITNWRHAKDSSSGCSAFCLCGDGSTNEVIALSAGGERVTDMFALPDGTSTLRVESLKSRRVEILSVLVVADYIPGSVVTNAFTTVGTRAPPKTVKDLEPGEWLWAVRSLDAEGRDSPWSPLRTVILDWGMPSYPRPGFCLSIQ